jgi:hypothetical protein
MYHGVDAVFLEDALYRIKIAHIGLFKKITLSAVRGVYISEVLKIARIGERVNIDDCAFKAGAVEYILDEIRSDKSGAAGHHDVCEFTHYSVLL